MLPFSPNARIPQLQQHPLMALQVHRILLPSLERCWVIRNSSLCLGKGTTFMNIGVHLRVSGRCFGFLGSARGWRSNPAEELIGAKLFSSRSGKSLLCKAETKEVGDSVELPNGKANSWVELVDDAKKHEEVVVGAGSLKEKMKVISKTSRSKKAVKTSKVASVKGKPESKKGNAVESGKKAAEGGTKKKTTAKNNRETTVAKAPAERNQKAVSKKEEAKKLEKSVALAAAEDEGLKRSSSRAKEANDNGALDVAKTNSQILQVGSWISGREKLRPLYPPSGRSVVVVESVTKAKVIQNYLGDMYEVLPSYGHVRDLAGKSRSVRPDDDFSMVWEVPSSALTHLKSIKVALSGAENLILASDPDREGEAIAWHITEMLYQQGTLNEMTTVARVVFHEITESSIKSALQVPRALDLNLINAYLARRALDYLIGFSISPLLWRKLPGCQSAGRVQSAALGLICDREMEIEQFEAQEYWTIGVEFHTMHSPFLKSGASIRSSLISLDSIKLDQLSISSSLDAEAVKKRILSSDFDVISVKPSKVNRSPPTPYITSTLQQDSSNKLRFSTNYTMQLAQKLYEGIKLSEEEATGLITYMRTDGLNISTEAATDIHSFIKERYGEEFASKSLRRYFKKVKNAQEAHEAIRPTNIRRLPSSLVGILDDDSLKLYTLIWTRTVACQMESSSTDMVQVDIRNTEGDIVFRSTGSKVGFPGYQAVYKDREMDVSGSDEIKEDITEAASDVLHMLKVKDRLKLGDVELKQHYTKPPPRYSEGALVKKLEELGIGRPSTYASIIKVLQDRNYVTLKSRVLYPEFRGRMVSAFLSHYFSEVADYRFTADMENELDNVSAGRTEWKGLLKDFWSRFSNYCDLAMHTNVRQVESMLGEKYGQILFSSLPIKSRVCPSCSQGTLIFKVSRFGAGYFIGCDQHPKCKYIAGNVLDDEDDRPGPDKQRKSFMPKLLGHCPDSNEKIFLKKGPYGYYVQLGDDRHGYTPKRASVTESVNPEMLTLEAGLELLLSKKTKKFSRPKKLRNPKEVLLE